MRGSLLVARREIGAYFHSMWGYTIVAAILIIDGLLFNSFALSSRPRYSADVLGDFFYFSFGTTIVASIFITMRLIAEDRQTGTMVLLDSSPLSDREIVFGKYLSAMAVLLGLTLLTSYMPALIFINGKLSLGQIVAGYVGLGLVGSAAIAVGTFGSAISRSQLVAAVLSAFMLVFLLMAWMLAKITDPPLAKVFSYAALYDHHFKPFSKGKINLESVVYYLSLTGLFLGMATRWMSVRRWK